MHFIVNLRSGRAAGALDQIRAFAVVHGAKVTLTERSRHASEIAHQALAEGGELIVAVGGDGTMNEVASVLVGTPATFGLVPSGSGDGLGRHLGIHGSVTRALNILLHGEPKLIDSGVANGTPFFVVAGLGFEAVIAERFNRLTTRGFRRYLTTAAHTFKEFVPLSCSIRSDGTPEHLPLFTLAVANTAQYGNNAYIAPTAVIDDGLLDLTVVRRITFLNAIPLLCRLFSGTLAAPAVWTKQAAAFTVDDLAPGLVLHTDGETRLAGPRVDFSVRSRSLRVMVPRETRPAVVPSSRITHEGVPSNHA